MNEFTKRRRLCPLCETSMQGVGEMPDGNGGMLVIWECTTCKMAAPLRRYRHLAATVYNYALKNRKKW